MEKILIVLIFILGLPLLFIGYKIGVGKLLYRDKWYKSFFFWYLRIASIVGISKSLQEENYILTLGVFIFVGFMWSDSLDNIYKKIMNIKDGVTEPFKGKTVDELNNQKIQNLQSKIKNTKSDIETQNKIKALEDELENLINPQPPSKPKNPEPVQTKSQPIKEINPITEENKKELKSVMNKLGF